MKAEEFKSTIEELKAVGRIFSQVYDQTRAHDKVDIRWLERICRALDQHRREMVAAETDRCSNCDVQLCGHGRRQHGLLCPECYEAAQVEAGETAALDTVSQEQHAAVIKRIWAIEERLGEIGAELKELTRVYVRHITRLHAVAKTVDGREYPMTPEDATESPPSSG